MSTARASPAGTALRAFVILLTECIGIVWVGKYLVVHVCVCLSVRARMPELPDRFQWISPQIVSSMSSCVRLSFSSLTLLMMSPPPYLSIIRGHCHGHSFDPIFLQFGMRVALLITRFGIVAQFSTLSTAGRNMGPKYTKWPPKLHFFANKAILCVK